MEMVSIPEVEETLQSWKKKKQKPKKKELEEKEKSEKKILVVISFYFSYFAGLFMIGLIFKRKRDIKSGKKNKGFVLFYY